MSNFFIYSAAAAVAVVTLSFCFNGNKVATRPNKDTMNPTSVAPQKTSFYDLKVNTLEGQVSDFAQYKGKKIIILNVASECGYTPQYADWQKWYDANKESAVVLGFPCNEFMGQEPGSPLEIATFCQKNYGVTFPMFEKVGVKKGDGQSNLYAWLSEPAQNGWNSDVPSWNFCKYLIDEKGELTHFFASKIKPDSPEFLKALGL